jgi:hypothetical protein
MPVRLRHRAPPLMELQMKNLSQIFKIVKPLVATSAKDWDHDKNEMFICYAIRMAYELGLLTAAERIRAKRLIMSRLGGEATVHGWLFYNGYIEFPHDLSADELYTCLNDAFPSTEMYLECYGGYLNAVAIYPVNFKNIV